MHFGKRNPHTDYYISESANKKVLIEKSTAERNLGITMSASLKHRDQCVSAANKALSCLGRLLGLDSLENRRIRTDIITFYKIVHSINTVNWVKQLTKTNPRGRSGFKFIRELNTRDSHHFFFTNRTIAIWNTLNEEEYTNAPSVQVLKSNLNKLDLVEMANKH